ncbi:hypothetical protein HY857_02135 [Candidatus Saccharibacteria bacterium]|nr:hypothetical protein [Candidatus Saccharibacteria bacterium]
MRVLIFGDSITQGFWDTEGGWVGRLRKHYDEIQLLDLSKEQPTIFNLGISGDFTKSVVARLESETKARLWPGEEIVYIFAVGLNDTIYREDDFESTPKKYNEELGTILKIAKLYSQRILFVGMSPVVDERVQPPQWSSSGKCYSNERIMIFDKVLQDFCERSSVAYVSLFEMMQREQATHDLMPDGAHPNNKGHKLIFQIVLPELEKLINT